MKRLENPPEISPEFKLVLQAVADPERFQILLTLKRHEEGMSFTQLKDSFGANNNTLDRHLKLLTKATLVWNFFERRQRRDYSFYKLSSLGSRVVDDLRP